MSEEHYFFPEAYEISLLKKHIDTLSTKIENEYGVQTIDFYKYSQIFNEENWIEVTDMREIPNLSLVAEMNHDDFVRKFAERIENDVYHNRSYSKVSDTTSTYWVIRNSRTTLYKCEVPTVLIYKINEVLIYSQEMREKESKFQAMIRRLEEETNQTSNEDEIENLNRTLVSSMMEFLIWAIIIVMWSFIFFRIVIDPLGGIF